MGYKFLRSLAATRRWVTVVSCVAVLLFATKVNPQIAGTGNIQGTVFDASGAVVPNASVSLIDPATQVKRTAVSNGAGAYIFPGIPIGTYNLQVGAPGFKTSLQTGIVLEVGSNIAVNASLQVGSQDVKVEVQAEGLALQTEDATFKQTIDNEEVNEMPLNGRQMTALIGLSGGSNAAPAGDFTGSKYSYATISVSIAGGGGNTTLWRLDGGDNQDYMGNGNLPYPIPDAVSEFSVESTDLGAQDGGHVGGMVNVVTKSGTNQYHGEAFEFIRNNYIDATNFFANTPDTLHQNQFGGTFGGPIKRNKMFAFAAYQRWVAKQTQAITQATVPTANNLAGDWSTTDPTAAAGNACSSKAIPLVDPLTGAALAGNKYASAPAYNATALALQKYLPAINPAYDINNCGNVEYAIPYAVTSNQFTTRVDYTVSSKQNIYGRYLVDGYQFPAYFDPHNILITTQSGNIQRVQNFTLGDAYTITPNFVNAAHISVMRRVNNRGYAPNDINATTLGITSSNLFQLKPNGLQLSEGKFTIGGGTNSVAHFNDNTLAIDDDVTWVKGKHQIAFGGEWVQNQLNIYNAYEGNGIFTFNGEYSGSGPAGGSIIGDQGLDFMWGTLGSSSPFQQSKAQQNALRGPIPSLYAQDTFHASSRLTLIGGLRYGPNIMPHDYFNRGVVFNQADFAANISSSIYPNAPAGALYYGDKGVNHQFTQNSYWQFSPNIGVSFDPVGNGKTVVRAGGALMYDNPAFFTAQRNQENPPFATAVTQTQATSGPPISFSNPWANGSFTSSPFPQPAIPNPATAIFPKQSQFIVMPAQFKTEYTIQWTVSIQREFGHGWQATVDYIGNTSRHAPIGLTFNPAVFIPGVWGAGGTGCTGIVTTGPAAQKAGAAGGNCSLAPKNPNYASRFLLTTENPAGTNSAGNPTGGNQYLGAGNGSVVIDDNGTANYNGLVASIQHRMSNTFSLMANWTWSKCLNINDAQGDLANTLVENPNNIRMDYGPCGSDFRHVENVVLVARSAFNNHLNRVEKLLANDWEFAPLVHIQTGIPFTVTSGKDDSETDVNNDRPNLVAGVNPYAEVSFRKLPGATNRQFLNPAAFAFVETACGTGGVAPTTAQLTTGACPALGTYGNVGRNSFRGPKALQFDAQISRIFPIHDNWTATLRLEAFNVLNHPDFQPPSSATTGSLPANTGSAAVLTSSTFGQVSATFNQARVFQGSIKINF